MIGWLGALLLLIGFISALVLPHVTTKPWYLITNIFGAIGIIVNTYHAGAYPAAVFNMIWVTAAFIRLVIVLKPSQKT